MSANSVIGLIEKIITSTPNTLRTVLVILLLIGAVVGGLWLLRANLTAGPITITGREAVASPVPCDPGYAAGGTSGACRR
ncbi:MAG TPA: hypothetical protein VGL02_19780 [Streptomyces sp.]